MGRRAITKDHILQLLEAYLVRPDDHIYAAALSGLHPKTCKKIWLYGWPQQRVGPLRLGVESLPWPVDKGIEDVLHTLDRNAPQDPPGLAPPPPAPTPPPPPVQDPTPTVQVPAAQPPAPPAAPRPPQAPQGALPQAVQLPLGVEVPRHDPRVSALAVAGARNNAVLTLGMVNNLLTAVHRKSKRLEKMVDDAKLDLPSLVGLIKTGANLARIANESATLALNLEKLVEGNGDALSDPNLVPKPVTAEEAEQVAAQLQRSLEREKRRQASQLKVVVEEAPVAEHPHTNGVVAAKA